LNPSFLAALSLGLLDPKPHPPSRCKAIIAPAHLPVWNPQQPLAQSLSALQGPVMNWVPGALAGAAAGLAGLAGAAFAGALTPFEGEVIPPLKPSFWAALSFGFAPKPQPPSRCKAMIAPAHLPVLKPQQPEAQSESALQGPVMNWVPDALASVVAGALLGAWALAGAAALTPLEGEVIPPVKPSFRAALSFGFAPKPQPPSRCKAMIAPAHLPVLKPQQPEAQSESDLQGPVMN